MTSNVRSLHKMLVPAFGAALLMGIAGASQAQYFDFTSTITPGTQTGTGGLTAGSATSTTFFTEVGATNPNGVNAGFPFGSNINVANFNPLVSNAADSTPDFFTSNPYTLTLTLTPSTSTGVALTGGQTQTVTGSFDGSASINASNVGNGGYGFTSLTYTFTLPSSDIETFTVTPNSFTGPTAPGGTDIGALQYHVVSNLRVTGVPEPGSVALLIGSGISGSIFLLRRRNRK